MMTGLTTIATSIINPSSPPFGKGRNNPSLTKRGEGRFDKKFPSYFETVNK
jgi:hypothetical protein